MFSLTEASTSRRAVWGGRLSSAATAAGGCEGVHHHHWQSFDPRVAGNRRPGRVLLPPLPDCGTLPQLCIFEAAYLGKNSDRTRTRC